MRIKKNRQRIFVIVLSIMMTFTLLLGVVWQIDGRLLNVLADSDKAYYELTRKIFRFCYKIRTLG